jgi:HPt (histidine-containing phosphotransfer) domain-containing protein
LNACCREENGDVTSLIEDTELTTGPLSVQAARPSTGLCIQEQEPPLHIVLAQDSATSQLTSTPGVIDSQSILPIDLDEALEAVDGDLDLLQDVVMLFLKEWPARVEALRNALVHQDATDVVSTAHRLKRALCNVGSIAARDLAQQLEIMGEKAKLDGAAEVLQALEQEIEHVVIFFSTPGWLEENACGCG